METNKTVQVYPYDTDLASDEAVLSTGRVGWTRCDWSDGEVWEIDLVVLNGDMVSETLYLHMEETPWLECTTVDAQQLWVLEMDDLDLYAWGRYRSLDLALTWASRGLSFGQVAYR